MKRAGWIGAALLAVAAALGLWLAPRVLLAAWLAAWWWCLGLVLGCFTNAWTSRLTGGLWGESLCAAALVLGRRVPWLLLALVPVVAGQAWLYPWADPSSGWLKDIAEPGFVRTWLSAPFFIARLVLYAIAWWWMTRASSLAAKPRAAASLLAHSLLTSLAAVDLLMSLMPGWYSTGFGLVVLSAQGLSGAALAVLLVRGAPGLRTATTPDSSVPVSRDLGNLMLMWTMGWGYLAFMQFVVIWSEDLPHEVMWYAPRLQTGWVYVALAVLLVQLALPFFALLFRSVKDHPPRLLGVAGLVLAGSALDAAWLVLPSVDAHTLHGWWLFPALFAGGALLLFAAGDGTLLRASTEVRHGV